MGRIKGKYNWNWFSSIDEYRRLWKCEWFVLIKSKFNEFFVTGQSPIASLWWYTEGVYVGNAFDALTHLPYKTLKRLNAFQHGTAPLYYWINCYDEVSRYSIGKAVID